MVVLPGRAAFINRWLAAAWRGLSRLPGLARDNPLFTVLLAAGLALRVIAMIAYQPAIFYIDSVGSYLHALPHLNPTGQDPIGYDLFLLGPVTLVANLATVVAIQHLLGLGIAVTGYVFLRHKGAPRWLAALAMAPVLLDAYQVWIETALMTEALFEAMLVAGLVALTWHSRPGRKAVIAAGLILGFAVTVRQAGELLILPLVVYPLLAGGAWRRRLARAALAAVFFIVPVAAYATYYAAFTGKIGISHVAGTTLYGRVAPFANCAGAGIPADERILCPDIPPSQRPGPDYWAFSPDSPYATLASQKGRAAQGLAKDFSIRIIKHQPLDFVKAVGTDAAKVFQWNRTHQFPSDVPVDRWFFPKHGFPLYLPLISNQEINKLSIQYGDGPARTVAPLTTFLRAYQLNVGYTPGPAVALVILLALAPLVRWRRAGPARLPALAFLAGGVLVLLAGDLVVFSWRYQLPGYILLPIGGALGLTAVVRRWRPVAAAQPAGGATPAAEPAGDATPAAEPAGGATPAAGHGNPAGDHDAPAADRDPPTGGHDPARVRS